MVYSSCRIFPIPIGSCGNIKLASSCKNPDPVLDNVWVCSIKPTGVTAKLIGKRFFYSSLCLCVVIGLDRRRQLCSVVDKRRSIICISILIGCNVSICCGDLTTLGGILWLVAHNRMIRSSTWMLTVTNKPRGSKPSELGGEDLSQYKLLVLKQYHVDEINIWVSWKISKRLNHGWKKPGARLRARTNPMSTSENTMLHAMRLIFVRDAWFIRGLGYRQKQ